MSSQNQKTIVITGCSSGIGYETAIACAKNDYHVIATVRDPDSKIKLDEKIKYEKLRNIKIFELDLSDSKSIESFVKEIISNYGEINYLFNNAGYMMMGSIEDTSIFDIRNQIETDLIGPIHLTKLLLPLMKKHDSMVINMSSIAGRVGWGYSGSYCTSKFGIEGFSESLRQELFLQGINVAIIEAGIVHTKFFDNMLARKINSSTNYAKGALQLKAMIDKIKNEKKWKKPEEVADLIIKKIIPNGGSEFRYVIGTDAEFITSILSSCDGNISCIDEIMQYLTELYLK